MPDEKTALLIVEDDVDVAEMLTAYFRAQGYEAAAVDCGEGAVQHCRANHPDLVILDIRLPDIDGFEVARRLRTHQRTQDIPIIFLTEKRDRSDRLQGLEVGADDYITKPFDIQELRLRVRNALRRNVQGSLTNPVTGLPEGALVDDRLSECLESNDWAMLLISIENLVEFRELYGFVASDDVQRAVSLMIHNAIRGVGGARDFVGQIGETDFVLVTTPANLHPLLERIRGRLEQSLDYFYPLKDRARPGTQVGRLSVFIGQLTPEDGPFKSLSNLKAKLLPRRV
ncbi:MAG: response regulator [Anaerolineales bacterium]|nr:response regulator [Anaerolineales bacterium]